MFKFIFLKEEIQIPRRIFAANILLIVFTVVWFLILNNYLDDIMAKISGENSWIYTNIILFYGFGAFSAILGSSLNEKIRKKEFLGFWIILGALTTASMVIFQGIIISMFLSILLGFSLGLGFPSITAILTKNTTVNERGRISGIIIFLVLIVMCLSMTVIEFMNLDLTSTILVLAILRMVSLFGLIIDYSEEEVATKKTWLSILKNKEFAYYIIPWIIFNIAAGVQGWSGIRGWEPLPAYESYELIGGIMFLVCASVSAFISGFFSDYYGRKLPIIIGLTLAFSSYAILVFGNRPEIIILNDIFAGSAWGLLLTVYITVPGDLALRSSKEKFYALGMVFPFIFFMFFSTLPQFVTINISPETAQPFLVIIISLCIIPILLAKETLPKRKLHERKMKKYVDDVGKLVQEIKKPRK